MDEMPLPRVTTNGLYNLLVTDIFSDLYKG
jgi:hypothetical protein